jgi:hypothetical protein
MVRVGHAETGLVVGALCSGVYIFHCLYPSLSTVSLSESRKKVLTGLIAATVSSCASVAFSLYCGLLRKFARES